MPAKKYTKKNPTVRRLSFVGSGGTTQFIDIGLALSILNQRAYRQGVYYYVNSIELYNNEDAYVDIHTVPDTWYVRTAYRRAKKLFDQMNDRAIAQLGSDITPKYHDFKVYMSDLHRTTGNMDSKLFNINSASANYTADEWAYSQFKSADDDGDPVQQADNFYVHMLGGHTGSASNWTSIGVVKSYADTKVRMQAADPNLPATATIQADPLLNIVDYSSEEQLNDVISGLADDNDSPPYDHNHMPGEGTASMQHVARLATSVSSGRVTKASGFCAPFGLICIDPQDTATAYRVVINLAQGTYNGVYAERV